MAKTGRTGTEAYHPTENIRSRIPSQYYDEMVQGIVEVLHVYASAMRHATAKNFARVVRNGPSDESSQQEEMGPT